MTGVASNEKTAIVNFIQRTAHDNFLREATIPPENQHLGVTTTPNFKEIKRMQRQGIIL